MQLGTATSAGGYPSGQCSASSREHASEIDGRIADKLRRNVQLLAWAWCTAVVELHLSALRGRLPSCCARHTSPECNGNPPAGYPSAGSPSHGCEIAARRRWPVARRPVLCVAARHARFHFAKQPRSSRGPLLGLPLLSRSCRVGHRVRLAPGTAEADVQRQPEHRLQLHQHRARRAGPGARLQPARGPERKDRDLRRPS